MPDASGNFRGISVPCIPWQRDKPAEVRRYSVPPTQLDPDPNTEGEWVEQYLRWRRERGYAD